DVAAPGENILSTIPGGKYAYMSGTSQATAFVTGTAALVMAKKHGLTPTQVRDVIRASVDKLPNLKDKVFAGGKTNAATALVNVTKMATQEQRVAVETQRKEEEFV